MSTTRQFSVTAGEEERLYSVQTLEDGTYQVTTPDGETLVVDAFSPDAGQLHLLLEGRSLDVDLIEEPTSFGVHVAGESFEIEVLNDRQRRMRAAGAGGAGGEKPELVSPMAGKVVQIVATVGQVVEVGDSMVVVEAMKMENDLKAHRAGRVASVEVEEGQAVEIGDVLVVIEDDEA